LSIPLDEFGRPLLGPADPRHVDAVEQHRQLRGVELRAQRLFMESRKPETSLLQTLVVEDEAAVVPGEDLQAVTAPGNEGEEMAGVDVFLPIAAHDVGQAIDAAAQIDRLTSEENADCPGEKEHSSPESRAKLGQISGVGADGEAHGDAAWQRHLHQQPLRHPRLRRG
jgi:hypothetical protein